MQKRGRPRKDGRKTPWFLFRTAIALSAYGKARDAGEKYEAALEAAIAAIRRELPGIPMSRTEMKRVLSEFRSNSLDMACFFQENEDTMAPDGTNHQRAWTLGIGEMPSHARHNARQQ